MYFIDRVIVAFCLMMHVSSVVRLICSATIGYCKSNLDKFYQQTNVLFLIFWLYCSSECCDFFEFEVVHYKKIKKILNLLMPININGYNTAK